LPALSGGHPAHAGTEASAFAELAMNAIRETARPKSLSLFAISIVVGPRGCPVVRNAIPMMRSAPEPPFGSYQIALCGHLGEALATIRNTMISEI
jgi:hypothetical protein